jgi:hypothetical protein
MCLVTGVWWLVDVYLAALFIHSFGMGEEVIKNVGAADATTSH